MKKERNNSQLLVFLMMLGVTLAVCYASVKYGQSFGYEDGYKHGHDKGYSDAIKDYQL